MAGQTDLAYGPAAPPDPAQLPPRVRLLMLLNAKWLAQCLYAVAKLGVADQLAGGPRTVAELAEATGSLPDPLHRVLRATATAGVFVELPDGRFALTAIAEYLRSEAPESVRHTAIMMGEDFMWRPYGQIVSTLRTGRTAFEHTYGSGLFDHLSQHPELQRLFDNAMTELSIDSVEVIVEDIDFSRFAVVADIGGGHGHLLAAILAANPGVTGILFDQPQVIDGAARHFREPHVSDRVRRVAGDFFVEVPTGVDAYVLRKCLHDWNDDDCVGILRAIRAAIGERRDVRLLVIEAVLAAGNEWDLGKLLDVEMLVNVGGRERTEAQWRALLARGGFRIAGLTQTAPPLYVIEAEPVSNGGAT
jgi:hypothetical protein